MRTNILLVRRRAQYVDEKVIKSRGDDERFAILLPNLGAIAETDICGIGNAAYTIKFTRWHPANATVGGGVSRDNHVRFHQKSAREYTGIC